MSVQTLPLRKELETYHSKREQLVSEFEGKFVVISGNEVLGTWSSYEDALTEGYKHYKLQPFLVKKIEGVERVLRFSRDLPSCQP
jgi:hypothetical protein